MTHETIQALQDLIDNLQTIVDKQTQLIAQLEDSLTKTKATKAKKKKTAKSTQSAPVELPDGDSKPFPKDKKLLDVVRLEFDG